MAIQVWIAPLARLPGSIMMCAEGDDSSQNINVINDMKVYTDSNYTHMVLKNTGDPVALLGLAVFKVASDFLGFSWGKNYYGKNMSNYINGYGGNDTILGGNYSDTVYGSSGNDNIQTGTSHPECGSNDLIFGGTGISDTTDGSDYIYTGFGNDTIYGNAGNDTIDAGNDIIMGGWGSDSITGGAGADTFKPGFDALNPYYQTDTITDFHSYESDKLNFVGIDANTVLGGTQSFKFIGTALFNGAGQLRFDAVNHVLYANFDNNNVTPEYAINLTGVSTLSQSDFVLV